ncbi:MAG: 2-amino-4-hydroxy-6-hydroxymethyldihydropteridine diphosphokinase [Actinobacteria bacterium]|uniref:2-amino-4-hydroxy-6-hydroxymethyldihydropteridine diphosphokinase n=1 Tax=freshwater metagenome TaxID=449393 RepID=A0A6J6VCC0_9ZZZZ|nr:2-amino-4-hydroxy-6-hydroxymethyldihydropteridine diphosphokinase [Actinomycetota bacterium]
MTRVVLSIGANLGDAETMVHQTIHQLSQILKESKASRIYQTAPVGVEDQPEFFNAVVMGEWGGTADELLEKTSKLEEAAGRERILRWGVRTLDIDIIAFGDQVSHDPKLTLPHPRAHERLFVLIPWIELQPDAHLIGQGDVRGIIDALQSAGATL